MLDISLLPKIKGIYRQNFPLSKSTWFQVGGPADIVFRPFDTSDLIYFLQNKPTEITHMILGIGSNILVRDGGIRGVVIRFGQNFTNITYSDNQLIIGAGALDRDVSLYCAENAIAGLEFLSGIPGVMGAAIAMNAGAYGQEIVDVLIKVEAVDKQGNIHIFTNEECGFKYRSNSLGEEFIFTKIWLKCHPGKKEEIYQKIDEINQMRETTQPIRSKTGGSSFKNPDDLKAWQLIDQAGCRGLTIGDAMISSKHCNFLINKGNATAKDLETLGELVREKVYKNSGIMLEWEIKIIGEPQ